MESIYSSAKPEGKSLDELSDVIENSHSWADLLHAWEIWRDATGKKIRPIFDESMELQNNVAKENGFADLGESWRISDFEDASIETEADEMLTDVMRLYKHLHAYVRRKLVEFYRRDDFDETKPIPAHLLGEKKHLHICIFLRYCRLTTRFHNTNLSVSY